MVTSEITLMPSLPRVRAPGWAFTALAHMEINLSILIIYCKQYIVFSLGNYFLFVSFFD